MNMASLRHLLSGPIRRATSVSTSACLRVNQKQPAFAFAARFESTQTQDDIPLGDKPLSDMTNEELMDSSTIPGWELVHNPPRPRLPRGCLVGEVVSVKMQKTVNVKVDRYKLAPKVRKRMKYSKKFFAHDENEVANLGDIVLIEPCQKISKHKHFMLREIIRAKGQLY